MLVLRQIKRHFYHCKIKDRTIQKGSAVTKKSKSFFAFKSSVQTKRNKLPIDSKTIFLKTKCWYNRNTSRRWWMGFLSTSRENAFFTLLHKWKKTKKKKKNYYLVRTTYCILKTIVFMSAYAKFFFIQF